MSPCFAHAIECGWQPVFDIQALPSVLKALESETYVPTCQRCGHRWHLTPQENKLMIEDVSHFVSTEKQLRC